ncbi:hypothetical protein AVEN_80406-1 [Araneus ventricosus]|uniref:DUF4371 domain-containing protein n=1 Tax=Araneus ventricosus TaxID=182803 RepID=A0A4Y2LMQ2_ARAVE|nr:hypothetical protein AVEN_80406-1 [Araneus ventricosus]
MLRPEISLSESSYSNAVSHSLSNDGQHFGNGDDVAGVENKTEDSFVKDDMFTKSRGKTYKSKLDLTETAIIAQRYDQRFTDDDPIKSLYFDGRKDETKTLTGIFREEHISLVAEPNSQYVGHVTSSSASAHEETTVIFECITSQLKGGFDEVDVLGCDGTNTNNGWKGGILRKLDELTGKPIQWAVCLLHFIELSFELSSLILTAPHPEFLHRPDSFKTN